MLIERHCLQSIGAFFLASPFKLQQLQFTAIKDSIGKVSHPITKIYVTAFSESDIKRQVAMPEDEIVKMFF